MKSKLNPRINNKKEYKKIIGICHFCKEKIYEVLHLHRIMAGADGGCYEKLNVSVNCSNCHNKIHTGLIKIDKWYFSSKGWVLHYWDENGLEHFD